MYVASYYFSVKRVTLSLCLFRHHAMNTYRGVQCKLRHWVEVSGQLHIPAPVPVKQGAERAQLWRREEYLTPCESYTRIPRPCPVAICIILKLLVCHCRHCKCLLRCCFILWTAWPTQWMNECMRGRPSRPLHRDLVVYCASPFSVIPSATPRLEWSVGFWTWGRQSSHLVPKNIDPGDVVWPTQTLFFKWFC
jgi:hypothetical protein